MIRSRERLTTDASLVKTQEEPPPVIGAKKAPDGHWYVRDSSRRGKYLRVYRAQQVDHDPFK
jgi:hypothetical protein